MKKYTALRAEPYPHSPDESRADSEELAYANRTEARNMTIGADAKNAMKFEDDVRRVVRHAPTAAVLRELLFRQDTGHAKGGWVFKEQKEWTAKGWSYDNIRTARRKLVDELGVVEEKRWYGNRLYYRIRGEKLMEWGSSVGVLTADGFGGGSGESRVNPKSRVGGSQSLELGVPELPIQRRLTEKTTENGGAAPAAPHPNLNEVKEYTREQDDTRADLVTSPKTFANGKPYNAPRVTEVLEKLLTHFDLVTEGFSERERGRYKAWFKELINDGVEPEQMFAVILHMLERRKDYPLTPKVAHNDVRTGKSRHRSMGEDEFVQGVHGHAANGTAGARGSRLPASDGSGRGDVPRRGEWVLSGYDVEYVVNGRRMPNSFLSWLLERAVALMWNGDTDSGRALAAYVPGEDMDPVLRALWNEVPRNENERNEWADNNAAVQSIVRRYKEQEPHTREVYAGREEMVTEKMAERTK